MLATHKNSSSLALVGWVARFHTQHFQILKKRDRITVRDFKESDRSTSYLLYSFF